MAVPRRSSVSSNAVVEWTGAKTNVTSSEVRACEDGGRNRFPRVVPRAVQRDRYAKLGLTSVALNAHCPTAHIAEVAALEGAGSALLHEASHKLNFSARGYHRVLKVARTLADLEGSEAVKRIHLAEAISFRMVTERVAQAA